VDRFGVSRMIVRHALGELVQEGRIYRVQGVVRSSRSLSCGSR
jgi:DNA-binding GntR family transcriptional regulator